jgi:Calcineurin-like phosphoesterase
MNMFRHSRTAFLFAALAAGALSLPGCGSSSQGDTSVEGDVGAAGLAVSLPGGAVLNTVSYTVTGPAGFIRTGTIDVSHSSKISVLLSLPAGGPYTIALTGNSSDGSINCMGTSSGFSVTAHQTTSVTVSLDCHEAPRTGSASINGTLNICPQLDGVSASPDEIVVGGSVSLSASAHDTDAAPAALSYAWSASAGTLSSATAQSPSFTCTTVGTATITVTASDGDTTPGCADTQTVTVTCTKATTTLAVFGDWPYGNIINGAPAFIAQVNADPDVDLVVHVGDIHSGSQPCGDAYNQSIFNFFQTFADPFVYTPGDNEWTDCQKTKEFSSGAPLDELAKLRTLFFANPGKTLGGVQKPLLSQATAFDPAHPEDAAYVENVIWEQANVLFVTLNIPGSNDDHLPWAPPFSNPAGQADEIAKRDAANSRWLTKAFSQATSHGTAGIFIGWQADMWDPAQFAPGGDGLSAYDPYVQQLATLAVAYGKPILLFNGDSHLFMTDQPLADPTSATGVMHPVSFPVPNLSRITVDGSTNFHDWVKLLVDPTSPAVFSWTRVNTP